MDKRVEVVEGNPRQDTMPDELSLLFGAPIFLDGEDPKLYQRLRDSILEERNPQTFMEKMEAHDLLTTLWEKMRYQCAAAAIIRAGCIRALQKLDGDVRLVSTKLARPKLPEETRNYFSREASKRKKARAEFEEFGISVAEVLATAAQLNSEPLQLFENMIRWRASHCRKVSKKARARTKPAAKSTGGIDLNGN
jgi:hypothetical protein